MTSTILATVWSVFAVGLPACSPATPTADGEPFHLKVGESAKIEGTDLQIGFEGVPGDSRCPRNVQCVWAGEATVVLSVRPGSEEETDLTFKVPPGGGATRTYRDFTIRIVGLEPQTESGKRIARDDYVVELSVATEAEGR
jgi:hypothetical protein